MSSFPLNQSLKKKVVIRLCETEQKDFLMLEKKEYNISTLGDLNSDMQRQIMSIYFLISSPKCLMMEPITPRKLNYHPGG